MECLVHQNCASMNGHGLEPAVTTLIRIYEKLAHCTYEKKCAISRLNSEVLAPIFKLLGTEDRLNIRLTCRVFKKSIDKHVGVHVNLDQRKIDSMQELSLPPPGASSIRLWSIKHSKYLDYLLLKPNLTTTVCFAGQISLSAFTKITSRCMNLRMISFTDRSHMYANIVPVSMHNLHTLDIGCPGLSTDYVGDNPLLPSLWLTYEILLRRLIAPNLKTLRIFFCCVEECAVLHNAIAQIFRFLAVHDKVKELSINLHHRYERFHFLEGDVNYRRFRIDVPKKILRRIQLEKLHVETMEPAFKVWDSILPVQRSLIDLDILNKGRRWFYFSQIIAKNFATLRVVRLHNISPKRTKTPVLDAGIFQECQVLETLFLSRFENSTQEVVYCYPNENTDFPFLDTETSRTPEMANLTKLPVTLKNLHIQGIVLSTNELCEGISKLQNIHVLELQLLGYHASPFSEGSDQEVPPQEASFTGLGVTGQVICTVIHKCRKLQTLFIEEFENPWTKIRGTKLGYKVRLISHIPGNGYFRDGEYYGILICSSIPKNTGRLTRSERMKLWGVRVSQYCHNPGGKSKSTSLGKRRIKKYERDGVKDLAELDEDELGIEECDNSCDESQEEIVSSWSGPTSTCLLEILDKENGQLEKIQRLLNTGNTPPTVSPTKLREEHTQKIAQEYSKSLFSAIPNYHKASRLQLDPTEKFTSFFPRSKNTSQLHRQAAVLRKIQNSQKLLQKF